MAKIQVPIEAYILSLLPDDPWGKNKSKEKEKDKKAKGPEDELQALANGLALPSFWSNEQIKALFAHANKVWAQAEIEFSPIQISSLTEVVPADASKMWIHFLNHIPPGKGIGAAFVNDLPSNEGGWGGGRIVVIAEEKGVGAVPTFLGSVLAHELGHVLLNTPDHEESPSNLMYHDRHPRKVNADLLEPEQIKAARERAGKL
jgi:hypothetical protein